MTTLYVSTPNSQITPMYIAQLIATENIECQVSCNVSTIDLSKQTIKKRKRKRKRNSCCNMNIEYGFKIKIFDLEKEDFKEKVWNKLSKFLGIKCAHIKYKNEYRGCVLNWPDVFVKNNCNVTNES